MSKLFVEINANEIEYDPRLTKHFSEIEIYIISGYTKLMLSLNLTFLAIFLYFSGFAVIIDTLLISLTNIFPNFNFEFKNHYPALSLIVFASLPFAGYILFKRMSKFSDVCGRMFYSAIIKTMNNIAQKQV